MFLASRILDFSANPQNLKKWGLDPITYDLENISCRILAKRGDYMKWGKCHPITYKLHTRQVHSTLTTLLIIMSIRVHFQFWKFMASPQLLWVLWFDTKVQNSDGQKYAYLYLFCNNFGVLSGIFWSGIVSTFSMLYTYTSNSITNIEKGCATCRRYSSVDPTSQLTTTTPCPSMLFPFLLQIEYCLALTSLTRYMYNVNRPDTILDIFHIHS